MLRSMSCAVRLKISFGFLDKTLTTLQCVLHLLFLTTSHYGRKNEWKYVSIQLCENRTILNTCC